MRVLMLNYEYPPIGGGAANATRYLLEQFATYEDLSIDLVTSSPGGDRVTNLSDAITVYRLDVGKSEVHYWSQTEILRYTWRAFRLARRLHSEEEYDLVHAWFGVPSGVIARLLDAPFLVALRGSDVPGYSDRFAVQYVLLKPLIRHVWRSAEAVIANSAGLRDLALETADPGIDVIPNGVSASEFTPRFERDGPLSVLCVARLIERKGIRYLVDAVANTSGTELTIVGEGEREELLRRRVGEREISDRVTFAGYVPHDSISGYYERHDVFVLPSSNEGMSNTVLEAMAAGLPIVTTDTGGTSELIDGNGVIIDERGSRPIANAIVQYRDDEELRRDHGRRSRALAEGMSWSAVADDYYDVYEKIR